MSQVFLSFFIFCRAIYGIKNRKVLEKGFPFHIDFNICYVVFYFFIKNTMKKFFSQHIIGYYFLVLVTIVLSGCVTPSQVTQDSKVDLTYTVTDPLLEQVIASGEKKDLMMDSVSMQLVHLLSGAKKDAVKFGLLTDPFLEYNYDLFYKQSVTVLREMGIPLEIGKVIDKK